MSTVPIDEQLATFLEQIETVAQSLFEGAVLSGQPTPSREHVEQTGARLAEELLAPTVASFTKAGTPPDELKAYGALFSSNIRLTFQSKWQALERLRAETTRGAG